MVVSWVIGFALATPLVLALNFANRHRSPHWVRQTVLFLVCFGGMWAVGWPIFHPRLLKALVMKRRYWRQGRAEGLMTAVLAVAPGLMIVGPSSMGWDLVGEALIVGFYIGRRTR